MTAHPGRLLTTYPMGSLARVRWTLNTPEFAELRGAIWHQLAREVSRAMEMQT